MTTEERPATIDLTAILAAQGPRRRATLDAAAIDVNAFGLGEILELSKAIEIEPGDLGKLLKTGSDTDKARVAIGLAWLIARRAEPDLTWSEVSTWSIEIRGAVRKPGPTVAAPANRAARRSRAKGGSSSPSGSGG